MKTGFSGTQHGMTEIQQATLAKMLAERTGEFHHGDCIGADAQAHDISIMVGLEPFIHPPDNPNKRAWKPSKHIAEPKPYLERNRDIVDGTDELIATPEGYREQLKGGTWYTIRYARKVGKPLWIIMPDGQVRRN